MRARDLFQFILSAFGHPKIRRAAWVAAGLWAAALLVLAFDWAPAALGWRQMNDRIEAYRRSGQAIQEASDEAVRYEQVKGRLEALETKWHEPVTQSGLIEELGALASRSGVKILSQNFEGSNGGAKAFRQTMSLLGSYPALRRFLQGMEQLPTLTVVQQAQMDRMGEDASHIRATLRLSTFLKPAGPKGGKS